MSIKICLYCGREIFGRPGYVCQQCERQDWYEPMFDDEEISDGGETKELGKEELRP